MEIKLCGMLDFDKTLSVSAVKFVFVYAVLFSTFSQVDFRLVLDCLVDLSLWGAFELSIQS